jgi:hypothetical protein
VTNCDLSPPTLRHHDKDKSLKIELKGHVLVHHFGHPRRLLFVIGWLHAQPLAVGGNICEMNKFPTRPMRREKNQSAKLLGFAALLFLAGRMYACINTFICQVCECVCVWMNAPLVAVK